MILRLFHSITKEEYQRMIVLYPDRGQATTENLEVWFKLGIRKRIQ